MKHPSSEQLILYHYGEAGAPETVRAHLESCGDCRAAHQELERLFAVVDAWEAPERSEAYGAEVWRRLRPKLGAPAPSPRLLPRWWLIRPRAWALAGGVALLLVAAFLAGRRWAPAPPSAAIAAQVRERILLVAVGDHLERSQMVLIELVNSAAEGPVDISSERRWSEELLPANRLYRISAARSGESGVASVLEELERTLLEIAHSPAQLSSADLERLRERIEARGILFKLRVLGSNVQRHRRPAGAPAPASESRDL